MTFPTRVERRQAQALAIMVPSVLIALLLTIIAKMTFVDPDMFHGMSLIRESLRVGHLVTVDTFAYTPTVEPLYHHEWGTGAVLYAVTTFGGAGGILMLKYALVGALIMVVSRCAVQSGASLPVVCALAPPSIFMSWIGFSTIRAQMFTLLFTAMLLMFLNSDRAGRRSWVLPWLVISWLWVNLHGGFVVGIILVAAHLCEQLVRRKQVGHLVAILIAMCVLIAVNPYGPKYYLHVLNAVRLDRSLITEWAPLWKAPPSMIMIFVMSVIIVTYAFVLRGVRACTGVLIVLVTMYAAVKHQRHIAIYNIVWLCCVPGYVEQTRLGTLISSAWRRQGKGMIAVWSCCLCAVVVLFVGSRPWVLAVPANDGDQRIDQMPLYPSGAVDYLGESRFKGNVMTPFTIGAYVSWKLYPDVKVSMDSRYEAAYPAGALEKNITIYQAHDGWKDLLKEHPTDAVLAPVSGPLFLAMNGTDEWVLVYRDDMYGIFARTGLELPVIDRRGEFIQSSFP